jgi:hypothetical protein
MKDGMDKLDRRQRAQYGSAVPPHMRHHMQGSQSGHRNMRVDAHGQVIIDPEENLSDKEIYPTGNHINIPSIGNCMLIYYINTLWTHHIGSCDLMSCTAYGSHTQMHDFW